MKKLLPILFSAICLITFSDIQAKKKEIVGMIINGADTIEATLLIPLSATSKVEIQSLHGGFIYLDSEGKKKKLKVKGADEVRFEHRNKTFCFRKRTIKWGGSKTDKFLFVEIDGRVSMYSYYSQLSQNTAAGMGMSANSSMIGGTSQSIFIQKEGQKLTSIKVLKYKKETIAYLSDCEDFINKVNKNEIADDIKVMVAYYNENCE